MTLNGCGCKESPEGELIFPKIVLSKIIEAICNICNPQGIWMTFAEYYLLNSTTALVFDPDI